MTSAFPSARGTRNPNLQRRKEKNKITDGNISLIILVVRSFTSYSSWHTFKFTVFHSLQFMKQIPLGVSYFTYNFLSSDCSVSDMDISPTARVKLALSKPILGSSVVCGAVRAVCPTI
jgi:hypothetical protein